MWLQHPGYVEKEMRCCWPDLVIERSNGKGLQERSVFSMIGCVTDSWTGGALLAS